MENWYESNEEGVIKHIDENTWEILQKKETKQKYDFILIDYEKPVKSVSPAKHRHKRPEKQSYPIIVRPVYAIMVLEKPKNLNSIPFEFVNPFYRLKPIKPKYEIVPYKKYEMNLDLALYYVDIIFLKLFNNKVNTIYQIRLPFHTVHFPLLDLRFEPDYSDLIRWLATPWYKKLYLFLSYRYRLLQKEISADYDNPTFARMTTDAVSLGCRWFLRLYRKGMDILFSWIRYFIRTSYKHLFGDTVQVVELLLLCAMTVIFSYSYMATADIYTETNTLSEFGHGFNVKPEIRYELGEPVILEPIYFLEDDSLDYASRVRMKTELLTSENYRYDEDAKTVRGYGVTILPAGEYSVQLSYGDQVRESKIIVEDTTPPDLSECDLYNNRSIRVLRGTSVIDIKGLLSAGIKDASLLEKRNVTSDSLRITASLDNVNTSKKGKYYIDVTVEDTYGNMTEPVRISVYVVDRW